MLNSTNNKEKKKISFAKKVAIFLTIFLVISVFVTAGLIYYKTEIEYITENKNSNTKTETIKENYGMASPNETYDVNDLKCSIVEEGYGDFVEPWGQNKVHIRYAQISGLKNRTIQTKINKKIKNATEKMFESSFLKNEEIEYVTINCYVTANFANVLSIQVDRYISYKNGQISDILYKGLNYNLATGEDIIFEKLFNSDANIKSILTQSAYEYFSYEYINNYDELSANMDSIDYSDIERKVYLLINKYNKGQLKEFYFDAKEIYLIDNENSLHINIKMADFYEQIAIYNRYKSYTNLYNGEYAKNLKDIPCFYDVNYKTYFEYDELAEGTLVLINVNANEDDSYYIEPIVKQYIEKEKNNYIQLSKNEKNVLYEIKIDAWTYEGILKLNVEKIKYELNPKKYVEIRDNAIYESLRNTIMYEGVYILTEDENEYYKGYTFDFIAFEYDMYSGELLSEIMTSSYYDVETQENITLRDDITRDV